MAEEKHKILLVDDEADVLDFIGYNLKREGYQVFSALDGRRAIELAKQHRPHLIILDVMMPGMDGMETCKELKKLPQLSGALIAFLTARNEDYSQLAGFDAGADDYIAKPIKPALLISRVKALLRRHQGTDRPSSMDLGAHFRIDRERYMVWKEGREVILPRKEFELLYFLASKPLRVFSRFEIIQHVWESDVVVNDRTIDVHIRKLREKIGIDHIQTVKGVGYKFVPEPGA